MENSLDTILNKLSPPLRLLELSIAKNDSKRPCVALSPLQEGQEGDDRILAKLVMEKFNERDDSKYPRNPQILYKTSKYPQQMDPVSYSDFKRMNSEKKMNLRTQK